MSPGPFVRFIWREARGLRGRLAFFVLCLTVGVAAVVAVAGVTSALESGIRDNARRLMAADLSIRSRRPIPDEVATFLLANGADAIAETREMAAMLSVPGEDGTIKASRLVELKTLKGGYPFYGEVLTLPPWDPAVLLRDDAVLLGREVAETMHLEAGDEVRIGAGRYRVSGVILEEPDRLDFSLIIGPRVMMSAKAFEAAGIGGTFSRVNYRVLARVAGDQSVTALRDLRDRLRASVPAAATLDVDVFDEAQPAVRQAIERVGDFLGLVALISLVLGGVGVAETVRTWLRSRLDAIAIVRALGLRPGDVFRLYLAQVTILTLVGSSLGVALGALCPLLLARVAPDFLPAGLVSFVQVGAWSRGLLVGVSIALVFAIPPLAGLRRVPCARVLRHDAEPLPPSRTALVSSGLLIAAGTFFSALVITESWRLAGGFTVALAVMAALLALSTKLLLWVVRILPRDLFGATGRFALAALARPAAGVTSVLVSLGLGVFVVTALWLVRTRLVDRLESALPERAPSTFLVDIQPDQWPGVRGALETSRAERLQAVPVAMARLAAIDGEGVDVIAKRREAVNDRSRWVLTREQRLTWLESLPESNRLTEGVLWSDPESAEVSLEERYARDLGVGVGSLLTFDVQGVPVDVKVTSLRRVDWQSFAINFFIVVEPGVLDAAPHFMLAAARLEGERETQLQNDVSRSFPNVTVVRVRHIIERVGVVVRRLAGGVEFIGFFTFAAGLAILAGAIAAQTTRRRAEIAVLKAYGATRLQVATLMSLELGLLGASASLVGGIGGFIAAGIFIDQVLDVEPDLPHAALPLVMVCGAFATAVVGVLAGRSALRAKPLEVLRNV